MGEPIRLIVGLGNVGPEYVWTPHNLGFLALDEIAARAGIRIRRPETQSFTGRGQIGGRAVVLGRPQTYMNASGRAVAGLLERYDCDPSEMVVLCDDVALPWGMLRIRERGSAGGHNGLKSIIGMLGSDEFIRVRMGVQPERPLGDLADYVLCTMNREKRAIAERMVVEAADAVALLLAEGTSRAMSRYNRRVAPAAETGK